MNRNRTQISFIEDFSPFLDKPIRIYAYDEELIAIGVFRGIITRHSSRRGGLGTGSIQTEMHFILYFGGNVLWELPLVPPLGMHALQVEVINDLKEVN